MATTDEWWPEIEISKYSSNKQITWVAFGVEYLWVLEYLRQPYSKVLIQDCLHNIAVPGTEMVRYGDGRDNTVEENSSIFFLIQMH